MTAQTATPAHTASIRALLTATATLREATARLADDATAELADPAELLAAYLAVLRGVDALAVACPLVDVDGRTRRAPVQWAIKTAGEAINPADDAHHERYGEHVPAWFSCGQPAPVGYVSDGVVTWRP